MEYIHWIGNGFWVYLLILCIPLIAYAMKYGRAVSDCQKMQGCVLNPYLTNHFRWWGKGAVDPEANKHWDKKLKDTKFQYQAFGLFHGKEVGVWQKQAHQYRINNWDRFNYPILNANIGHALFNVAMFGFFAFPMGFALIAALAQKPLRDIGIIASPEALAAILILPIVISRSRKLKKAAKDIVDSGTQPQTGDNLGDYEVAWERRGSIMNKILIKYFDSNEDAIIAYANEDHLEDHCAAYTKICKDRNSEWTLVPDANYVEYSEGGRDRNLFMGILLIGTIAFIAIIGLLQLEFLVKIIGAFFDAIGSIISLPTKI